MKNLQTMHEKLLVNKLATRYFNFIYSILLFFQQLNVFSNDNLSILEIFEQAMKDIKNGASISQAARKHNISRKALSRKVISVMI
jgi:hypothetical protein